MNNLPRFLTPKAFGETFHYHRSTVAKWLPDMRLEGVATGHGKATRIEVEPAREPFITKKSVFGVPNLDTASTSYVERNNGTMRHHIGRMRRLCLAFSKKLDNHRAAIALAYVHYNLCHVVSTLRVTPAMAAHVTDHVWDLRELLDALTTSEPCDAPEKQALASRVPVTTHRELPTGRGFLRVVDGGKSSPKAPTPIAPTPAPIAAVAAETSDRVQLDLFDWKPNK